MVPFWPDVQPRPGLVTVTPLIAPLVTMAVAVGSTAHPPAVKVMVGVDVNPLPLLGTLTTLPPAR